LAWRLWAFSLVIVGIILCVLIAVFGLDKQPQKAAPAPAPLSPEAMEDQALALQDKGHYAAAEDLFRRCLENLARALRKAGKLEEAEQLASTGLTGRERILGSKHPDTFGNMATLADILRDKGDASGAAALYDQALEGLQQSSGPAHPDTLRVLYEYSLLRKDQRQGIEARRLAYQLMAGARRTLPQNHPDRVKYEQLLESLR